MRGAKIAMMSRDNAHPSGVANSGEQVGRNLLTQLDAGMIGLTKDPIYPYRGPVSTSGIKDLRDGSFRGQFGACAMSPSNEGWTLAIGPMKGREHAGREGPAW